MFYKPFPDYTHPSEGKTFERLRGDNHLEIFLFVRNAGAHSRVSVSWNSPLHPEIEQFGREIVEGALASLPDDPIKISRKTEIIRGVAHWSITFIPADHALDLAAKIFPQMIELWNAWCRAAEANPGNIDMHITAITRNLLSPLPDWLSPPVNATN